MKKRKAKQSEEADTPQKKAKTGGKKAKKESSTQLSTETNNPSSAIEPTKNVQLNSLQSIFATTDKADRQFTLFSGESIAEEIIEIGDSLPPLPVTPQRGTTPQAIERTGQILYFFPHYDDPVKNANSLFAEPDELFFYTNRTEYLFHHLRERGLMDREDKRRIWQEGRYELTQDWKKKRKAAMKLKRRMEIRRKL